MYKFTITTLLIFVSFIFCSVANVQGDIVTTMTIQGAGDHVGSASDQYSFSSPSSLQIESYQFMLEEEENPSYILPTIIGLRILVIILFIFYFRRRKGKETGNREKEGDILERIKTENPYQSPHS